MRFGVAGAGLTGAVIARQLAEAGHRVVLHDTRDHIAGNCHTERDAKTGIMLHRYGPHIFHTGNKRVWQYVNRHADMIPYRLAVRATAQRAVYSLPVNLHTINQVYGRTLSPGGARRLIASEVEPCEAPDTFEQAALATIGRRLYGLLFEGYTAKQWGRDPSTLPASVFHRLPIRYTYDDNYFTHPHQAIPRDGYTAMIGSILDHPNIGVELRSAYPFHQYDHTIWTGELDAYFDRRHGPLAYRTLTFQRIDSGDLVQGCAIMTHPDRGIASTRCTEHKLFAPWEHHTGTVAMIEYSSEAGPGDTPFYPVRLADDEDRLRLYLDDAAAERGVTFAGRLGTYRYLDMDVTIAEALTCADRILEAVGNHDRVPSLTH